jgi:CRISPR type III-A-associated RAMP protein Csm4
MTLDIFKLYFQTPLHLSRGKLNSFESSHHTLHSDTLKSAMFVTARQLYGKDVATEAFFDSFQLSSAFPFTEEGYFFPKPLHFEPKADPSKRKLLKGQPYIPLHLLEMILRDKKSVSAADLIAAPQPEVWSEITEQHVSIDREDSRGEPFYVERLFPKKPASRGLFFILWQPGGVTPELRKQITQMLQLLGENGLGLKKSVGNGSFIAEHEQITLDLPDNTNASMALSLYHPQQGELDAAALENGFYDFIQRGGWMASPEDDNTRTYRKKSVYMFTEGSVFPAAPAGDQLKIRGKKAEVAPDNSVLPNPVEHPVWREGTGLFLPIKM